MSGKPFLDSNVILYAFTSNDPRQEKALALLAVGGTISVQVLNEFVNVSRRKVRRGWAEIEEALRAVKALLDPPCPLTTELHDAGIVIARDHGYRFYDSLVIAAALQAGCSILYSEDLHHGQTIGQLRIQNPFR